MDTQLAVFSATPVLKPARFSEELDSFVHPIFTRVKASSFGCAILNSEQRCTQIINIFHVEARRIGCSIPMSAEKIDVFRCDRWHRVRAQAEGMGLQSLTASSNTFTRSRWALKSLLTPTTIA